MDKNCCEEGENRDNLCKINNLQDKNSFSRFACMVQRVTPFFFLNACEPNSKKNVCQFDACCGVGVVMATKCYSLDKYLLSFVIETLRGFTKWHIEGSLFVARGFCLTLCEWENEYIFVACLMNTQLMLHLGIFPHFHRLFLCVGCT